MVVRLRYRHGSFRREETFDTERAAILRAAELTLGKTCSEFELVDAEGMRLQSDTEVARSFHRLGRSLSPLDEPTPPEAA